MRVEVNFEYHTKSRGWEWKSGGYAYETSLDLKVGDVVLVPSLWGMSSSRAAVSRIGTEYSGPVRHVIRRATPEEQAELPVYKALEGNHS